MSGLAGNLTNYQAGSQQQNGGTPPFFPTELGADNAAIGQDVMNQTRLGAGNMARGAAGVDRQVGGGFDGSVPAMPGGQSPSPTNVSRPSFMDAVKQGGENASNPGLSRGGKFLAFLGSIAQGAAAGSAGGGFSEGGKLAAEHFRREKQDKENAFLRHMALQRQQQQDELDSQYKHSQIAHNEAQTRKLGLPDSDLRTVGNEIVKIGQDGQAHPIYQGKTKEVDDESTFAGRKRIVAANPDRFKDPKEADRYIKYGNRADININTGGDKPATRAQKAKVERDKSVALARAEEDFRDPSKGDIYNNPQELERRKRQIQDDYESQVVTLGGSIAEQGEGGAAPPRGSRIRNYTQF